MKGIDIEKVRDEIMVKVIEIEKKVREVQAQVKEMGEQGRSVEDFRLSHVYSRIDVIISFLIDLKNIVEHKLMEKSSGEWTN